MRQYIAQAPLSRDGMLTVSGKDYRYFKQVLRIAVGDMVQVRFLDGSLQSMTVCRIDERSRRIVLQICAPLADEACAASDSENMPQAADMQTELWLFQFVARSAKMDVIIRQATECGVSVIVPVLGEYSQNAAADRNFRSDRYDRIIREARQQSGSAVETRVHSTVTLPEAIALWKAQKTAAAEDTLTRTLDASTAQNAASLACVLYERTEYTKPLHVAVREARSAGETVRTAALVCGAEGGISVDELSQLTDAGFVPIHFKTNILRCETAALYGIAALQSAITEGDVWQ